MAFRKRVYRRRYKKRNYNKRYKGKKLATRNYVRKAIGRTTENKLLPVLRTNTTMKSNILYVFNPSWQIQQGSGSSQRIGRSIRNLNVKLNFAYTHQGTDSLGARKHPSSVLRMLVLTTPSVKTAALTDPDSFVTNPVGMSSQVQGQVFYELINHGIARVDNKIWTVHKDVSFEAHSVSDVNVASGLSGNTVIRKNIYIPIHKRCTYRNYNTTEALNGFLSESEVYICFIASASGALPLLDNMGSLVTSGIMEWEDA